MAFYYKGRYLGDDEREAYDNLSRKEASDIVFDYLMRWSSMDDMARMIADDCTGGSESWAMSALEGTRKHAGMKGGRPVQNAAGLVWRDEGRASSGPKASSNRKAPARKPTNRRR